MGLVAFGICYRYHVNYRLRKGFYSLCDIAATAKVRSSRVYHTEGAATQPLS